ncbi:MAG: hypothetical protein WAK96_12345 [Desulfobaccales bacterium]
MGRKKRPEPDDKEQFARFIEAAKQIENPDAKKAFEEAFDKIVKKKKVPKIQNH